MRWRVILPLDEPVGFTKWQDAQAAFFDYMEDMGVEMDRALERAGQLVFLPNVPPMHLETGGALRDEEDRPLYYAAASTGTDAAGLRLDRGPAEQALAALCRRREADERLRAGLRAEAARRRSRRLRRAMAARC